MNGSKRIIGACERGLRNHRCMRTRVASFWGGQKKQVFPREPIFFFVESQFFVSDPAKKQKKIQKCHFLVSDPAKKPNQSKIFIFFLVSDPAKKQKQT